MSVWEGHGVLATKGEKGPHWVQVSEGGDCILLTIPSFTTPGLTAAQARYLASKLNRLAKRIEQRAQPKEKTP